MASRHRRGDLNSARASDEKLIEFSHLGASLGSRLALAAGAIGALAGCGQSVREAIAPQPAAAQPEVVGVAEPAAAEPVSAEPPPPVAPPPFAGWVMAIDHGIRADKSGQGQFLAPRYHGKHNGVDLLAPIGTPVLAACAGQATRGVMGGYGKWVKLVCRLPSEWVDGYVSVFYSHLSEQVDFGEAGRDVKLGETLGRVGKTGNAAGASVMPHLHLELIVHATEKAARAETHSGRDQSNDVAADAFVERLDERCLNPLGLKARSGMRRERRLDPYLVLGCLGAEKPAYQPAPGALRGASSPWHDHYDANKTDADSAPFVPSVGSGEAAMESRATVRQLLAVRAEREDQP